MIEYLLSIENPSLWAPLCDSGDGTEIEPTLPVSRVGLLSAKKLGCLDRYGGVLEPDIIVAIQETIGTYKWRKQQLNSSRMHV